MFVGALLPYYFTSYFFAFFVDLDLGWDDLFFFTPSLDIYAVHDGEVQ